MQFFTFSALPLASTFPCIPVFLMPGQTQIIDTFPDKWQDRNEQTFHRLRVELINCLLQTCYKLIWAATSLWRSYLLKCSQVYCETRISETCQDMSRFHQVCQLRRNTFDSTLDKQFYLRQNTAWDLYLCHVFQKAAEIIHDWILLSGGKKTYLDHKQTGSNYPEAHMPCSKHKKHHSK